MSGLTLASTSSTRARLLENAGLEFDVVPSNLDEMAAKAELKKAGRSPASIARILAEMKALEASHRVKGSVIGADQTLEFEGFLFDKPGDLAQLRSHLAAFRGRSHDLHAAAALARDGALIGSVSDTATLYVRAFSDAFLERYLEREGEAVLGCVGGYRVEGEGAQLFETIKGDVFTILGLPLVGLLALLRNAGVLAR